MADVKPIFIRLSAETKDRLDDISKNSQRSVTKIVNRVLDYFVNSLNEGERRQIIEGVSSWAMAVGKSSSLVEGVEWASHALSTRQFGVGGEEHKWLWACEEYRRLAAQSEAERAQGTWKLAQYKLGFCCFNIGNILIDKAVAYRNQQLRENFCRLMVGADREKGYQYKDGIREDLAFLLNDLNLLNESDIKRRAAILYRYAHVFEELVRVGKDENIGIKLSGKQWQHYSQLLDKADWIVRAGFVFSRRYKYDNYGKVDGGGGGGWGKRSGPAVIVYNSACGWALRATLKVLGRMKNAESVTAVRAQLRAETSVVGGASVPAWSLWAWKEWREHLDDEIAKNDVENCARKALKELADLCEWYGARNEDVDEEYGNLPKSVALLFANADSDFYLLKKDSEFREKFEYIVGDEIPFEQAVGELCRHLENDIDTEHGKERRTIASSIEALDELTSGEVRKLDAWEGAVLPRALPTRRS